MTRLLRNQAQIADFCAIFLHKTGLLCKVLSETFTFWTVRREISGSEREIPSPGILFSGLGNFISGLGRKKSRYRNFFAVPPGVFFFPVGTFSRIRFPCHFVGGILRRAFPPVGLPRRECPVSRQKDRLGGDSATFWFPHGACGCVLSALSRPGGRIRESRKAKMSKLSTRTRKCHSVNGRMCAGGVFPFAPKSG